MAFIGTPTPLLVRARAADGTLQFSGKTKILVRYLRHRNEHQPKSAQLQALLAGSKLQLAERRKLLLAEHTKKLEAQRQLQRTKGQRETQGCAEPEIPLPNLVSVKAHRPYGGADLDPRLFELRGLGLAAKVVDGAAEVHAAEMTFHGDDYTQAFPNADVRMQNPQAQALFEAFLEQETILIQVEIADRYTASLALKLDVNYLPPPAG